MTITASVVIKHTTPFGVAAVFGATKVDIVLQFEVNVSTMAEVEERVASLIRAGLAPDASERAFEEAYAMPPTVDADLETGADIAGKIKGEVPLFPMETPVQHRADDPTGGDPRIVPSGRGKHSGDCKCKGCAEPDPDEVRPIIRQRPVRDNPQA